jgi:hypothetical protein
MTLFHLLGEYLKTWKEAVLAYLKVKGKGKDVPLHAMKAPGGEEV